VTHDDAFLQDVLEHPEDDTPRLVYADWLEEHGLPERAEFIRVQCELAKLPEGDPRAKPLAARERVLLARHAGGRLGGLRHPLFRRGFLESARVNAQTFVAHADALFRLGPLRHVDFVGAAKHVLAIATSPHLARLEVLTFTQNRLADWGAECLARCRHLARLGWLGLARNQLTDHAARALAACPHLAGLTTLRLEGNYIGDDGLLALAESPHLGNLASLHLGGGGLDRRRPGARALLERFGERVRFRAE
jgi:uncharacterized protein (TIGR02996 family)